MEVKEESFEIANDIERDSLKRDLKEMAEKAKDATTSEYNDPVPFDKMPLLFRQLQLSQITVHKTCQILTCGGKIISLTSFHFKCGT